MNEFIKKLIERLEETRWTTIFDTSCIFENDKLDKCIEIVNQLAEEYNNESVKTNVDYIRNMTDEELAEYASHFVSCGYCDAKTIGGGCGSHCKENLLKWLKAEREE